MLKQLVIKNYALINEVTVDFSSGFNVITGETGAGKSILLGGLSLVLGNRADLTKIKDRSKKCIVEALFDVHQYDLKEFFHAHDLDYDRELILRRELLPSGKSRAFVNDTPVTLDVLSKLSSRLIDVHSQNQSYQLMEDNFLLAVIDAHAGNGSLMSEFVSDWKEYKESINQIKVLESKQSEANRLQDYNSFLLNELNELKVNTQEYEALEEQKAQLENTETIQQNLQYAYEVLTNDELGVISKLKELRRSLDEIEAFSSSYAQIHQRILSCIIELEDISNEVSFEDDNIISDPAVLNEVNETIEFVNQLMFKHNTQSFEELLSIRAELTDKVEDTLNLEERIQAFKSEKSRLERNLVEIGKNLSSRRHKSIPNLKSALETMLHQLGIPNAQFQITLNAHDGIKSNGIDDLSFKFTANRGSDFKELKLAASGGELSRIMLCIKSILAINVQLPTLIFDEIDTGVSGEVADKIGEIMKEMSSNFQLICISHLPQIAAKGEMHFKVFKVDEENSTQTRIKMLKPEERIQEIAQMLGGNVLTDSAVAHAKQLLN